MRSIHPHQAFVGFAAAGLIGGCNAIFGLDEVKPLGAGAGGLGASTGVGASGGAQGGEAAMAGIGGTGGSTQSSGGNGGNDPCGNGIIDAGETCDGDCIEPFLCFDADQCTTSEVIGAAECNAECVHTDNPGCVNNDGCCPNGCGLNDDNDCNTHVLIVAPDPSDEIRDVLAQALSPYFVNLDTENVSDTTPSVSLLASYYAVVYVGYGAPFDATALGNALADYHDLGGRVVMMLTTECDAYAPAGRFRSEGYYAFPPGGWTTVTDQLFTILEPTHPLIAGIGFMDTQVMCQPLALPDDTLLIGSYANGQPLLGTRLVNGHARVDINVRPNPQGLQNDLPALIANAVFFSQGFPDE